MTQSMRFHCTLMMTATCLALMQASCGSERTQVHAVSKKTIVYSINGGSEVRLYLDYNDGEIAFKTGDRLKVIALEFNVNDWDHISQEDNQVRLQAEILRYVEGKIPDTWEDPQVGEWISAKKGHNRAGGNGHEWVLTKEHNYLDVAIVDNKSGSLKQGNLGSVCRVGAILLPDQTSREQWRTARNTLTVLKTNHPILIRVSFYVFAAIAVCMAIIGTWGYILDRRERTQKGDAAISTASEAS